MLTRLKELFKNAPIKESDVAIDSSQIAVSALLIEAALSDEEYSDTEREMIAAVIKRHFSLSDDDVELVINKAEIEHKNSDQLLYFTRTIKDSFPLEDRVGIIEMLWETAYADGELSAYEANLVRRICGLIYVSDIDSGKAKKRVLKSLGLSS